MTIAEEDVEEQQREEGCLQQQRQQRRREQPLASGNEDTAVTAGNCAALHSANSQLSNTVGEAIPTVVRLDFTVELKDNEEESDSSDSRFVSKMFSSESEVAFISHRHLYDVTCAIPDEEKSAYIEALEVAPSVVLHESNPTIFLRFAYYNAWDISVRLVQYWKHRKYVFGDRSTRPLTLHRDESSVEDGGSLEAVDVEVVERGAMAILPNDEEGRCIFFVDLAWLHQAEVTDQSRLRVLFFLLRVLYEREESRTKGVVGIIYFENDSVNSAQLSALETALNLLLCIMPIRIKSIHLASAVEIEAERKDFIQRIIPASFSLLHKYVQGKIRFHVSKAKVRLARKFKKHGIALSGMPTALGGTWTADSFVSEWKNDPVTRFSNEQEGVLNFQLLLQPNQSAARESLRAAIEHPLESSHTAYKVAPEQKQNSAPGQSIDTDWQPLNEEEERSEVDLQFQSRPPKSLSSRSNSDNPMQSFQRKRPRSEMEQPETTLREKRIIYSRRKRQRQKLREQSLNEQCVQLKLQQKALHEEGDRLTLLLTAAEEEVKLYHTGTTSTILGIARLRQILPLSSVGSKAFDSSNASESASKLDTTSTGHRQLSFASKNVPIDGQAQAVMRPQRNAPSVMQNLPGTGEFSLVSQFNPALWPPYHSNPTLLTQHLLANMSGRGHMPEGRRHISGAAATTGTAEFMPRQLPLTASAGWDQSSLEILNLLSLQRQQQQMALRADIVPMFAEQLPFARNQFDATRFYETQLQQQPYAVPPDRKKPPPSTSHFDTSAGSIAEQFNRQSLAHGKKPPPNLEATMLYQSLANRALDSIHASAYAAMPGALALSLDPHLQGFPHVRSKAMGDRGISELPVLFRTEAEEPKEKNVRDTEARRGNEDRRSEQTSPYVTFMAEYLRHQQDKQGK